MTSGIQHGKAVIYTKASGSSLLSLSATEQARMCREVADMQVIHVIHGDTERPGLSRLRGHLKQEAQPVAVLISEPSRLGENATDCSKASMDIFEAGGRVYPVCEPDLCD